MSKPHISFRPKPELEQAIRAAASADRRTVSQFVANLVEDAIAARQAGQQRSEAA
ncbi:DUF1778 domain-containing protein [Bradyrhizobium sp. DASA03076]|uniref:type II toxin -antitoxin system TacA 1-like antitoxin n=1 Tax=Bradyrhizobium sp. BLXBL-03 TaxID=3395916 RepID=UPI003F702C21